MPNLNYIFVKGDVSGIQGFIFNVKSEHAAKELKGRSFFIKMLVEVAIQYLLDQFGLVDPDEIQNSKISTSGGNFILKLPALDGFANKVLQAQKDFTKALEFTGLNMCIAYVAKSETYANDIMKLDAGCRTLKYKFYHEGNDYFDAFEKKEISKLSTKWESFTTQIKSNQFFTIQQNSNTNKHLIINNNTIELAGYKIILNNNVNGFPLSAHLESLFPENASHGIKDFSDLSKSDYFNYSRCEIGSIYGGQEGLDKLGILAMDVDGLGHHMAEVDSEEQHADLDKKLRLFFNDKIREVINNTDYSYQYNCRNNARLSVPKFKNKIYSVTAGGDDCFFVGKWNTILDFAIEINKAFTTEFHGLTISAGLIIVDPKFPVVRFADLVESSLKKAKYDYDTKGNICLFGEVLSWDMLEKVYVMRQHLNNKDITGGMLAKARLAANNLKDAHVFRLEDFWKMGYYLRDLDSNKKRLVMGKIDDYMTKSILEINKLRKRNYRSILPVAARLAELDKR
ncbi:MAG: hypothetical protein CVT99_10970 [Bacteroidetes bacterium HGW-Bacteroidetes-16]|jgi:CRISPR-associated protein Csm1|nr:MAG: hypothetical protein CVT99_10970 [Bacteroidetes bacterium HGW-Bacteroidetes-16]